MKKFKPKFWNSKYHIFTFLLLPISYFVKFLSFIKKKFIKAFEFEIPIICVGNIYLGGTGKTPLAILVAKELRKIGKNPSVIRKYYKEHIDEHLMIKKYFENLIVEKNRKIAIENAISNNFDSVIMDDGFQDNTIKKNMNIVCFNDSQLIGNGFIIPAGPLRESLQSLNKRK